MNDRFKFRAWIPHKKRMFEWKGDTAIHNMGTNLTQISHFKDSILLQCTGLKDKNGELVYDADIVSWRKKEIFKVVWKSGGWQLECLNGAGKGSFCELWFDYPSDRKAHEVIGNIYENPDLIK